MKIDATEKFKNNRGIIETGDHIYPPIPSYFIRLLKQNVVCTAEKDETSTLNCKIYLFSTLSGQCGFSIKQLYHFSEKKSKRLALHSERTGATQWFWRNSINAILSINECPIIFGELESMPGRDRGPILYHMRYETLTGGIRI